MSVLSGVRIRCPSCNLKAPIGVIDGQAFDPTGWERRGSDTLCPACAKKLDIELHPEVLNAAENVVHKIQALMATELSTQPPPGTAITFGKDGMARRMKRCELLARYADVIMTLYGNLVSFRLASTGAFGHTTLGEVAVVCETLMKAEIAFSQARANRRPYKPTSNLAGTYSIAMDDYTTSETRISGPLYRLQEVSKVAQKLAQLAATRAGEMVTTGQEDSFLHRANEEAEAFAGEGLYNGRYAVMGNANNDAAAMQRQLLMVAQRYLEKTEERAERAAAAATPASSVGDLLAQDPLYELERLLETRKRLEEAGRAGALQAIDARIALAEARLRVTTEQTTVDSVLAAEAGAKDVTPPRAREELPPDASELAQLRRNLGDAAVRAGFPTVDLPPDYHR